MKGNLKKIVALKAFLYVTLAAICLPLSAAKLNLISTNNALWNKLLDSGIQISQITPTKSTLAAGEISGLGFIMGLNGNFYLANSLGILEKIKTDETVANLTYTDFHPTISFNLSNIGVNEKQIEEGCDNLVTNIYSKLPSKNLFYAVKITGEFNAVEMTNTERSKPPYENIIVWNGFHMRKDLVKNINGTIIMFLYPQIAGEITNCTADTYFISSDNKIGGRVTGIDLRDGKVEAESFSGFSLTLPETEQYLKQNILYGKSLKKEVNASCIDYSKTHPDIKPTITDKITIINDK